MAITIRLPMLVDAKILRIAFQTAAKTGTAVRFESFFRLVDGVTGTVDCIDALHALGEAFDKLEGRRGLPNTPNQAGAEAAEPSGDEPPSTLPALMKLWRTGRKVGRTIYEQRGEEPFDGDELIGLMDSRELAAAAVEAHNQQLNLSALRAATAAYLEALKGPDDQALLNTRAAEIVAAALSLLAGAGEQS